MTNQQWAFDSPIKGTIFNHSLGVQPMKSKWITHQGRKIFFADYSGFAGQYDHQ